MSWLDRLLSGPMDDPAETRSASGAPYTDAISEAILAQASGADEPNPGAIAAVEAATCLWSAAFSGALLEPAALASVLTPSIRALAVRDLLRRGESLFAIEVARGRIVLRPVGSWDVRGPADPERWTYRVDTFGPSSQTSRVVPAAAVLHLRWSIDPARPWRGVGPLEWARSTAATAAGSERVLAGETSRAKFGYFLPLPEQWTESQAALTQGMRNAQGGHLIVRSAKDPMGMVAGSHPEMGSFKSGPFRSIGDYKQERFGPSPPESLTALRTAAAASVLSALGIPPGLTSEADGTLARASWQRFLAGAVEPLLECISDEIEAKLERRPMWDLSPLLADMQVRSQALDRMVKSGIALAEARRLTGF